ncbi:hypothetical protein GGR52DRAFT_473413 [Hypoxylon sp. FL1284]|nr:hypothetical protein GGR52DRAFT_473413 [Hypoxylon sp. FL1284]
MVAIIASRLSPPPTDSSYRLLLQTPPTDSSYRLLLQTPPTDSSYRLLLQTPPTDSSYRLLLQTPPTDSSYRLLFLIIARVTVTRMGGRPASYRGRNCNILTHYRSIYRNIDPITEGGVALLQVLTSIRDINPRREVTSLMHVKRDRKIKVIVYARQSSKVPVETIGIGRRA